MSLMHFPSHSAHCSDIEVLSGLGLEQIGVGLRFSWPCWIHFPLLFFGQLWSGCRLNSPPPADIWLHDPPSLFCDLNHRSSPHQLPQGSVQNNASIVSEQHIALYVCVFVGVCVCVR